MKKIAYLLTLIVLLLSCTIEIEKPIEPEEPEEPTIEYGVLTVINNYSVSGAGCILYVNIKEHSFQVNKGSSYYITLEVGSYVISGYAYIWNNISSTEIGFNNNIFISTAGLTWIWP